MKSIVIAVTLSALAHAGLLASSGLPSTVDRSPGYDLRVSLLDVETRARPARFAGDSGAPLATRSRKSAIVPADTVARARVSTTKTGNGKSAATAGTTAFDRLTRKASAANATRGKLRQEVLRQINDYFYYPRVAQQRGIEGEVRVRVRIDANGRISGYGVTRGSGYTLLDEAALESLRRVAHSTRFPGAQDARLRHLEFPIQYQLLDSRLEASYGTSSVKNLHAYR